MREILFKAKWLDNGEWVEGDLLHTGHADVVLISDFEDQLFRCDGNTLCQYTGLTDKNGQKIWEYDILKGYQYPFLSSEGKENYYAEVVWFTNCNAFGTYTFKNPRANVCGISEGNTELMEDWNPEDWEVIGNIFDNADLLEV